MRKFDDDIQMELSLELMAIVSADHLNEKLKIFKHVIDKVECIRLSVSIINPYDVPQFS